MYNYIYSEYLNKLIPTDNEVKLLNTQSLENFKKTKEITDRILRRTK